MRQHDSDLSRATADERPGDVWPAETLSEAAASMSSEIHFRCPC
jgi:hypothetical protein